MHSTVEESAGRGKGEGRMKQIGKRAAQSFAISAICGLVTNLLVELVVRAVTGDPEFTPYSPEFLEMFPSMAVAVEVNILLYGLIGASFSAATAIYEKERIGFLLQNLLYFLATGIVWIPIVTFLWQLNRYPEALYSTIFCFFITYCIMTVVGYHITRRDVKDINQVLEYRKEV